MLLGRSNNADGRGQYEESCNVTWQGLQSSKITITAKFASSKFSRYIPLDRFTPPPLLFFMFLCPSIHLSIRLYIRLTIHPSVRPSVRPPVHLSIRSTIRPSAALVCDARFEMYENTLIGSRDYYWMCGDSCVKMVLSMERN